MKKLLDFSPIQSAIRPLDSHIWGPEMNPWFRQKNEALGTGSRANSDA